MDKNREMKTILVTGSKGFIGRNLAIWLSRSGYSVLEFTRSNNDQDLINRISNSDAVIHLAGANRPENDIEFMTSNLGLTQRILNHIRTSGRKVPVLLCSSIQAERNTPYGLSKLAAENEVRSHINEGHPGVIYRLHNVFGKWSRPNYNTVVATFCANIAKGADIRVDDPDTIIQLVYIDDVVREFVRWIANSGSAEPQIQHVKPLYSLSLRSLADKLFYFRECLGTGYIPDLNAEFDKKLLSVYLSFVTEDQIVHKPELKSDDRGWLFEFIKSTHAGQVFVSTTKPGVTRGNHFHHTKIEKFCVIQGAARIAMRHLVTDMELTFDVVGSDPEVVHIPPGFAHNITNVGQVDMIALFWANEIFDPEDPDTYFEAVK